MSRSAAYLPTYVSDLYSSADSCLLSSSHLCLRGRLDVSASLQSEHSHDHFALA
jgi:hypothetical protein